MKYISSDTNIWLDFHSISMLEIPFKLPYTYIMYSEAIQNEILEPPNLFEELIELGLVGVEISTDEFYKAAEFNNIYKKISGYDAIALAIAYCRKIVLITGDNALRKAAQKENVQVMGTIGILDELFETNNITRDEYIICLTRFDNSRERRLPVDEIKKRIISFKGGEAIDCSK